MMMATAGSLHALETAHKNLVAAMDNRDFPNILLTGSAFGCGLRLFSGGEDRLKQLAGWMERLTGPGSEYAAAYAECFRIPMLYRARKSYHLFMRNPAPELFAVHSLAANLLRAPCFLDSITGVPDYIERVLQDNTIFLLPIQRARLERWKKSCEAIIDECSAFPVDGAWWLCDAIRRGDARSFLSCDFGSGHFAGVQAAANFMLAWVQDTMAQAAMGGAATGEQMAPVIEYHPPMIEVHPAPVLIQHDSALSDAMREGFAALPGRLAESMSASAAPAVSEPKGAKTKGKRPRGKTVTPEQRWTVQIAQLTKHHGYTGDEVLNETPLEGKELADKTGESEATISRFFKECFGSHRGYLNAIRFGGLLGKLRKLNGDCPDRAKALSLDV